MKIADLLKPVALVALASIVALEVWGVCAVGGIQRDAVKQRRLVLSGQRSGKLSPGCKGASHYVLAYALVLFPSGPPDTLTFDAEGSGRLLHDISAGRVGHLIIENVLVKVVSASAFSRLMRVVIKPVASPTPVQFASVTFDTTKLVHSVISNTFILGLPP